MGSWLQQCLPDVRVSHLIKQKDAIQERNKFGTSITYGPLGDNHEYSIFDLVITGAGRPSTSTQPSAICGVLICSLGRGAFYQTVSWTFHNSKHSIKPIAACKILAAGEGIDERAMFKKTNSLLPSLNVNHDVVLDSKDFYTFLSTHRHSINRSVELT